jgi:hypothetical protein
LLKASINIPSKHESKKLMASPYQIVVAAPHPHTYTHTPFKIVI